MCLCIFVNFRGQNSSFPHILMDTDQCKLKIISKKEIGLSTDFKQILNWNISLNKMIIELILIFYIPEY